MREEPGGSPTTSQASNARVYDLQQKKIVVETLQARLRAQRASEEKKRSEAEKRILRHIMGTGRGVWDMAAPDSSGSVFYPARNTLCVTLRAPIDANQWKLSQPLPDSVAVAASKSISGGCFDADELGDAMAEAYCEERRHPSGEPDVNPLLAMAQGYVTELESHRVGLREHLARHYRAGTTAPLFVGRLSRTCARHVSVYYSSFFPKLLEVPVNQLEPGSLSQLFRAGVSTEPRSRVVGRVCRRLPAPRVSPVLTPALAAGADASRGAARDLAAHQGQGRSAGHPHAAADQPPTVHGVPRHGGLPREFRRHADFGAARRGDAAACACTAG
eukprot:COSAG01_NODE_1056_length_11893_cov_439.683332_11_plen_331_part_00